MDPKIDITPVDDRSERNIATLLLAYETTLATTADPTPTAPTHLMLYFQKP